VAGWREAGVDVLVAYPWPIRRADKSDFNDVMKAAGIEAVRARIEAALHPHAPAVDRVDVEQARAELAAKVGGFMAAAAAWTPPGDDGTDDEARPALPPPVHALRVDVGAGKSEAARRGLVRLVAELRAKGDRRNVAIAVPTHALGGEQAQKLLDMPETRAARLTVRVWRGREAADPEAPGQAMCRDLPAVTLAQDLALIVQRTVCRRILPDGTVAECPFFTSCGYQRQRRARADIWIVAHQLVFSRKPDALGELAAVAVDEGFWQAGLVPEAAFPVDALDPATLPDDLALDPLPSLRAIALDVLRAHDDGPILREKFLAAGLSEESATTALRLEWDRQVKPPELVPGMSAEARRAAAAAARGNRLVLRLARFWRALRALLAEGGPEASGWLALGRADDGTRLVLLKGRRDVAKGWRAPSLILDATLRPELVRPFYPQARFVADIAVVAPHMRVRQVIDRAYSLAMLDPEGADDTEERRRRMNNLHDLRVTIDTEARRVRPRRLLVVAQKRIEEALRAMGPLPPNVDMGHHNAVAGRDEWRDVGGLVVAGRTMPPPGAVNQLAEALSGSAVPLLSGWYQRADATRETLDGAELAEADRHPDPLGEAIRWTICEGELVQIIGRGRGVNRTAADPLDVLILTDVPVPVPVAETMPAAALDPTLPARMLAEGGVAFENSGHALQAYPGLWPSKRAAEQAFYRGRCTTNPYEEPLLGECRAPLRVAYQVVGPGQRAAVAWFDPLVVPDPEAWLSDRLGPLAWCRPDQPPVDPPGEAVLVPGCVPALPPEVIRRPPPPVPPPIEVMMPPAELLTVRGPGGRPIMSIEAPRHGPIMGSQLVTLAGPGPWLLLARPPDPDDDVVVPHPAFLPATMDWQNSRNSPAG
jgi:putative DNA primase/helicase